MLSDELLAAVAECDEDDAAKLLSRLRERVGIGTLRDQFYKLAADAVGLDMSDGGDDAAPIVMLRAGDFLRSVGEPPRMLVEGLIPEKSLVLLAGKPKFGKSLLALDIADAICRNRPVWGEYAVNRAGPVVYLGMEDQPHEIANRLLKHGMRPDDTEHQLRVIAQRVILDAGRLAELALLLTEVSPPPALVIVDTAREAFGIRDWNNTAELSDRLRPLRKFARSVCSVLVVTHNRKAQGEDSGDEIAGSNALTSSVDGWLSAIRKEDAPTAEGRRDFRLTLAVRGRGGMHGEPVLHADVSDFSFRALTDADKAAAEREARQGKRDERYGQAAAIIAERGGRATISQIAGDMGIEYHTCSRLLQEMIEAGALRDTGEKQPNNSGKGRPAPLYENAGELLNYIHSSKRNGVQINKPTARITFAAPANSGDPSEDVEDI